MKVSALIPVKGFGNAKQRLSPLLHATHRKLLAEIMFRDVLRQIVKVAGLAETFVVTGNEEVAEFAPGS
jgi:2-phospho-L-lactate guanylyltransferase (CobY/MobA/RfbA family)